MKNKCIEGCRHFPETGDIRHSRECPNYPNSMSHAFDYANNESVVLPKFQEFVNINFPLHADIIKQIITAYKK